jgi:hypothetical protein
MPVSRRNKLVVPALLAVSVLASAPGCSDDEASSSSSSSTGPADVECYDRTSEKECKVKTSNACKWFAPAKACEPDCPAHRDREECRADRACGWFDEGCHGGIA